jgi:hypothetical protein
VVRLEKRSILRSEKSAEPGFLIREALLNDIALKQYGRCLRADQAMIRD